MTKYYIQKVRKDDDDEIIRVKTRYNEFSVQEVIQKIEASNIFVVEDGNTEVTVKVIEGPNRKYIRTVKDGKITNNLDELPRF